ncbi:hypothetical protein KPH14_005364 [Odynerus spinipes]|uniref:Uncharacterized protein n=1 Tax=Odynerus spinipes TaxID=1348599 RepID=A0AAD9RBL3_9HYME|nr:hypothetical protein KPH14_005364 [Odynerus spinipes]
MRKLGMCKSPLVTRLTELNEQLVTIAKLQKMEDEYDRSPVLYSKLCDCAHHMGESKKKISCNVKTCKARKRCTCLCKSNKKKMEFPEKQVEEAEDVTPCIQSQDEIDMKEEACIESTEQMCDTRLADSQNLEKSDSDISVTKDTNTCICKTTNTDSKLEEVAILPKENIHDRNIKSEKCLGRIQKDLTNEKKQKKDLEEKLQCLQRQHVMKLKEDEEHRISCSRNAHKAVQVQFVQSKKETCTITEDRDKLLQTIYTLKEEMNTISSQNVSLNCQCQDLKCKLQAISESETKSCTVVQDEINHIKCISKQKEEILQAEINELKGLVTELTNVTKIQERRICELTNVCKRQQCSLHKKNKILMERGSQMNEMQCQLNSYRCKCTEMQNEIQNLQSSLNKESDICKHVKEELERYRDDYNCMLNIKTKIIEEQDETIKKQKRLLQDSERMAQQAACEFEEIRNELVHEKETCESLRFALITAETQLNQRHSTQCRNCQSLMAELDLLDQQKQKALAAAKEALQKLCTSARYFQRQLACKKQQCQFLTLKLKEKQQEVENIKEEFAHRKKTIIQRRSDFLL